MNWLIKYLDLASQYRREGEFAVSDTEEKKLMWWPQYLALLLGIMVQPYLQQYINTKHWHIEGIWGWMIASVFIAIMAFPAIYKSALDPTKPIFVQFCVIFTAGMGWQTIVNVVKATT
jgi:hypothetical protein